MTPSNPASTPQHVIDRDGLVWRVVRDGGMATRADYTGIESIGIEALRENRGPLVDLEAALRSSNPASGTNEAGPMPEKKYAVTVEGGWLQIVVAPSQREAERKARRDWNAMQGQNVYPEVIARPATDDDIAWHKAMGGGGGD